MTKRESNKVKKNIKFINIYSSIVGGNSMRKNKEHINLLEVRKKIKNIITRYDFTKETSNVNQLLLQLHQYYKNKRTEVKKSLKKYYHLDDKLLINIINNGKEVGISMLKIRTMYYKLTKERVPSISTFRLHVLKTLGFKHKKEALFHIKSHDDSNFYQTNYYLNILDELVTKKFLIVYVDESSFCSRDLSKKVWTSKKYPHKIFNNGRTKSFSLLLAITSDFVINYKFVDTKVASAKFCEFIEETVISLKSLQKYKDYTHTNSIAFVFDNAKIHLSKVNQKKFKDLPYKFLTLPTYFSRGNPVELVFGYLKRAIYRSVLNTM